MPDEREQDIPPVTLIGLHVESVKKIHVVDMSLPPVGVVRIVGANEAGKSSILGSVESLLRGAKADGEMPIHKGSKDAEAIGDFGAFKVKRRWTEKTTTWQVTRNDKVVPRPEEFLKALVGAGVAFDPGEFVRRKPKDQIDLLLKACPLSQDPRELDKERKEAYDKRTGINQRSKALKARIDAILIPENTPDAEVPTTEIVKERDLVVGALADRRALIDKITAQNTRVAEQREVLRKLQQELRLATEVLNSFEGLAKELSDQLLALPEPTMDESDKKLAEIEATNRQVRIKKERAGLTVEYDAMVKEADELTGSIEWLDNLKAGLLAEVTLPVEGLAIEEVGGEHQITIRGIPVSECSASQSLKLGMAIAMALNPKVRIIVMQNASLMDKTSIELVDQICREKGYQCLCEIVGDEVGEAGGFLLVEGELKP